MNFKASSFLFKKPKGEKEENMWQVYLVFRLLFGNVFAALFQKSLLNSIEQKKIMSYLLWQYILAFLISLAYFLIFADMANEWKNFMIIFSVGCFLNPLGVFCQWQAVKINLSKTALLTQLDDIIAVLLGLFVLKETQFLSPKMIAGAIFCFLAAGLLASKPSNRKIIFYILGYSFFWGLAAFSFRWLALKQTPFPIFMLGWYSGSLLGMFFLISLRQDIIITVKEAVKECPRSIKANFLVASIWGSMLLTYMLAKSAPLIRYQPILMVAEALLPAIIGLYIFKERKKLSFREICAFIIGAGGVSIIALT